MVWLGAAPETGAALRVLVHSMTGFSPASSSKMWVEEVVPLTSGLVDCMPAREHRGLLDAGAPVNTGGCAADGGSARMQGVMVKPSFKRGSHTFLFPVVLAAYESSSWQIMLGAGVLPPLAGLLLKYCVVRPLRRRYKLHKVRGCRCSPGPNIRGFVP